MRNNPLRTALSKGQLVRGAFQTLADPSVAEILLGAGFDFTLIDGEHRALNPESIENSIRAAQGVGRNKGVLARVKDLNRASFQYPLDAGAHGVLAPLVNTRADAENVVSLCRYPPLGSRGLNSANRPSGWGMHFSDPGAYAKAANKNVIVAAQIETPEALEKVDAIAETPGLDLIFVGPFDLSHGLGHTGQLEHPKVRAAIERIFATGLKHGKWLGVLAPDVHFAQWCVQLGVRLLVYKSDARFMRDSAIAAIRETGDLLGGKKVRKAMPVAAKKSGGKSSY